MKGKKWGYITLLVGAVIVVYVQANKDNTLILSVFGWALLLFGLARISFSIKGNKPEERWIKSEEEEE